MNQTNRIGMNQTYAEWKMECNEHRRTLAQIADRVTEYILGEQSLQKANETLVLIREQAQDALK